MSRQLLPVNLKDVIWRDGQDATEEDFTDEQTRNVGIDAATVNNFFGSGIINEFSYPPIIFDSSNLNTAQQNLLDSYAFDGSNIYIGTNLPVVSDVINGINLTVQVSGCNLDGTPLIKISIIGDTFGDALVHDDFTFNLNGSQTTRNRYKNIRAILFNNFAGSLRCHERYAMDGYDLVGKCLIRETKAMEVSIDPIVFSQVAQPSIYWGNFLPASYTTTINEMLQDAIGADKSLSDLNIGLSSASQREIEENDVTTKVGQKFLANGTNIQKISTLLSVKYNPIHPPLEDGYKWSGDIILTLNKLQTEVECPVAPTPDTAIDFDPDPTIIYQIALSADDMKYQGVVLDGDPQVVDFVFTNSNLSTPTYTSIEEGTYYVFSLGRAGDASVGTILIEEADDIVENSYMVVYDGTQWINITDSDMWFVIYGDYIKVSDGIAYNNGIGIQIPRIAPDTTNAEAPYVEGFIPFYTVTYDDYNYVLLEEVAEESDQIQDQRTGDWVESRYTPGPEISLINESALTTLLESEPDPIILAKVEDLNPRGNPSQISGKIYYPGLVIRNKFNILNPDADILQNNLVGSILYPNPVCGGITCEFRIIKQTNFTDAYGDVNGDGEITVADLSIISGWLSSYGAITISDPAQQYLFYTGLVDTAEFMRADVNDDGTVDSTDYDLIEDYINKVVNSFPAGSTFTRTELIVENLTNPLSSTSDIPSSCCTAFLAPILTYIPWRIDYFQTWIPDMLIVQDMRRLIVTTFTDVVSTTSGGQNNFFIPGDLIIEGNILNPDTSFYSVDLEVNQVTLDIPITDSHGNPTFIDGLSGILLFDNFVAESSNGFTTSGFVAMKYADGSYVQTDDFVANKVKISATLQSITNEYNAVTPIKDLVGMYYDSSTSLLMLYIKDLYDDGAGNLLPTLSMKILVSVYLKHASFVNANLFVPKDQMRVLLGI